MRNKLILLLTLSMIISFTFATGAYAVEEVNPNNLPTRLSEEEIESLGESSPEEVREEITLVGDLLNYLYQHYDRSGGNVRVEPEQGSNDHMWEFLEPAKSVIETKTTNCAGSANLAAYVLENNYDEVGYLNDHRGFVNTNDPGGHVISYVKDGENYIVFDPQQAIATDTYGLKGHDLDEIAKYYAEVFNPRYGNNIAIVVVVEGEGLHAIKGYAGGKEWVDENRRERYPDYYEDRAWVAWEDPDDPYFTEFGDGPGFTPVEYREYFRDDEGHYLHTTEPSLMNVGAIAAGLAILIFALQ